MVQTTCSVERYCPLFGCLAFKITEVWNLTIIIFLKKCKNSCGCACVVCHKTSLAVCSMQFSTYSFKKKAVHALLLALTDWSQKIVWGDSKVRLWVPSFQLPLWSKSPPRDWLRGKSSWSLPVPQNKFCNHLWSVHQNILKACMVASRSLVTWSWNEWTYM